MIRELKIDDIEELRRIHDKYFSSEFSFDEFFHNSLYNLVVTNDNSDSIISAASIRPITEVCAITDKSKSIKERRYALYQLLEGLSYIAQRNRYDQLHCFVQDDIWLSQLMRKGFRRTKGESLVIDVIR